MKQNTDAESGHDITSRTRTSEDDGTTSYGETNGHGMDNVLSSLNHHEQQPSFPPELYSPSEIQRVTDTQPDHEMFSGDVGGDGLASTTFEATNLNDDEGEPLSSIWNTLGLPPVVSHEQQHRSSSTSAPPPDVPPPRPLFHAESDRAQLGFYGPTSQCYLQYPCHGPDLDDLEIDPSPPPPLLLKIDADSPSARKAVLESYWKSNELWSSIVDRCFFIAHKAAGHASQYYSQGLEDAMLACGSRNSTSSAIRKVGREYLRRAKMNLQIEIENPTVAALQGCLLVSNYEAGTGQNRIGWMFMGKAYSVPCVHDYCCYRLQRLIMGPNKHRNGGSIAPGLGTSRRPFDSGGEWSHLGRGVEVSETPLPGDIPL